MRTGSRVAGRRTTALNLQGRVGEYAARCDVPGPEGCILENSVLRRKTRRVIRRTLTLYQRVTLRRPVVSANVV
jgi:hypothetical protein